MNAIQVGLQVPLVLYITGEIMMIDKETYMTSEGFYKATVEDLKRLKMNYQNEMKRFFSELK